MSRSVAVINSTPIITLCNIGMLELLRDLFDEIHVPHAVFDEVTIKSDSACDALLARPSWISFDEAPEPDDPRLMHARLHTGEVEVMTLARKIGADIVVLDDNTAKRTAEYLGLDAVGTLGLLVGAKNRGLIDQITPLVRDIKANGFFLSPRVESYVLELAGESREA